MMGMMKPRRRVGVRAMFWLPGQDLEEFWKLVIDPVEAHSPWRVNELLGPVWVARHSTSSLSDVNGTPVPLQRCRKKRLDKFSYSIIFITSFLN
jgi:hypothetical protein